MRCSTKIYKGDEGGSRVILRYCNDSPEMGYFAYVAVPYLWNHCRPAWIPPSTRMFSPASSVNPANSSIAGEWPLTRMRTSTSHKCSMLPEGGVRRYILSRENFSSDDGARSDDRATSGHTGCAACITFTLSCQTALLITIISDIQLVLANGYKSTTPGR
jgi:hypothetical protein